MIASTTHRAAKELAFRAVDGLEVALLWHERRDFLSVAVLDTKTGDSFELVLDETDDALDVFDHPYAYAAHRGLDYGPALDQPGLAVAA